MARICVARIAAFFAPALPMASVPTGTPAGICTIDSSESRPFKVFDCTGTPSTGSSVMAAAMPGSDRLVFDGGWVKAWPGRSIATTV